MGKRVKLGLIFSYNESWIGGSYYILNLISALKKLSDKEQPHIVILSDKYQDYTEAQKTDYTYLSYFNPYKLNKCIFSRCINFITNIIFKINLYDKLIVKNKINVLFPANNTSCFDLVTNKIYWFPDFQHLHYPENFIKDELDRRNEIIQKISKSNKKLVLSSKSVEKDLKSITDLISCKVFILPFAVSHPDVSLVEIDDILAENSIVHPFFIVSNQYWNHKNHKVVLEAAKLLKKSNVSFQIIFTGKNDFIANNEIYNYIIDFIKKNNLEDIIKILGLIDRKNQLVLMKKSIAVIQPSLFEGWSTVIEDAKALKKNVIASDILIHREQIFENVLFFNPLNEIQLYECMTLSFSLDYQEAKSDYDSYRFNFATKFLDLIRI